MFTIESDVKFLYKYLTLTFIVICMAVLFNTQLFADLSASPIIMHFDDGDTNRKDITVANLGKYTKYLEVSALRITNLGEQPEILETDPDPNKLGLLVAPRRLTLKPGEEKVVRVIRLEKAIESDEAWRVHIRPAKAEIESKSTGVMAQIAYKALVFARPKNADSNLVSSREGNILKITNSGNSNVLLYEGKQCDESKENCKKIIGKRLWPGASLQQNLIYNTPVKFKTLDVKGKDDIVF